MEQSPQIRLSVANGNSWRMPKGTPEIVTKTYLAVADAQEALLIATNHPLVEIDVQAEQQYTHSYFKVTGSIRVPRRTRTHYQDIENARELASYETAKGAVRDFYAAIDRVNEYLMQLKAYDYVIHLNPQDISGRINLGCAILTRFPRPARDSHEEVIQKSMMLSIWLMRDQKHRDTDWAEMVYGERFDEPCPDRPAHVKQPYPDIIENDTQHAPENSGERIEPELELFARDDGCRCDHCGTMVKTKDGSGGDDIFWCNDCIYNEDVAVELPPS